jgi:DNA-binding MarR family transcriptional regulator
MPDWTFITKHGAVLSLIDRRSKITAREIAAELGITERSVHRIIKDLEKADYIKKRKKGRTNSYKVNGKKSLRRKHLRQTPVGDLLKLLDGKEPPTS